MSVVHRVFTSQSTVQVRSYIIFSNKSIEHTEKYLAFGSLLYIESKPCAVGLLILCSVNQSGGNEQDS